MPTIIKKADLNSDDPQTVIHIQDFGKLRRAYRFVFPFLALSIFSLWDDGTGFRIQIIQAFSGIITPVCLYGAYALFHKHKNATSVRLEGSRITVGGTNISVHMTEISKCRLGKNFDGTPNVIILDLTVPRLFWVPGLMLGVSKAAVFRVDGESAERAIERIGSWLENQRDDIHFSQEAHTKTFIRPATKQDAHLLANILNPIIERGGTTAYEDPVDTSYFEAMIAGLGPRDTLFVAEQDGRVVGYQVLEASPKLPENVATIASFVAIGTAAKGVGQAMAAETVRAAKAAGWQQIDATIRADNKAGLAYYSRLGFQDHKVHRGVPLKDGTPVDRISKRLSLS